MRRKLFNLAAAVSLVLCVAVCASWVDTVWFGNGRNLYDEPIYTSPVSTKGRTAFKLWAGELQFMVGEHPAYMEFGTKVDTWSIPGLTLERMSGRTQGYHGHVRHWLVICTFAIPVALWMLLHWWTIGHRHLGQLCAACGYDLRATPERCPECGAIPHWRISSENGSAQQRSRIG